MGSVFLGKSIAVSLIALLLVFPATSLGAACTCSEAGSACLQVVSTENPLSFCCAESGDGAGAATTCCWQLAVSGSPLPAARAMTIADDPKPQLALLALEGSQDSWRTAPSSFSVLAAPDLVDRGSHRPAYLVFCSFLI